MRTQRCPLGLCNRTTTLHNGLVQMSKSNCLGPSTAGGAQWSSGWLPNATFPHYAVHKPPYCKQDQADTPLDWVSIRNMQASSTITKLTDQKADPPGTGRIEPGHPGLQAQTGQPTANQTRQGRKERRAREETDCYIVEFSTWEQEENKCLLLTKILAT